MDYWRLNRQRQVHGFLTGILPYLHVKRALSSQALGEISQILNNNKDTNDHLLQTVMKTVETE